MDYNNYNNDNNTSFQGGSNDQMFEGGGFDSFGDNGFDSGMMPPVQTVPTYVPDQGSGLAKKLAPIVGCVAILLLVVAAIGYSMLKPYLALNKLSKRAMDETYIMNMTMNVSGDQALSASGFEGITIKGVKGEKILSMDMSSSVGKMMIIYSDLQDPSNMVIDIKPLFETLAKNLGSYGLSFDTMTKTSDSMAFSAEQLAGIFGKDFVDIDQLQSYNDDFSKASDLKTLKQYFEYDKKVESQYKVLGDDAYYFRANLKEVGGAEYENAIAYLAVDKNNRFAGIAGVNGMVTSLVYTFSFGPVEEPVMPDVSENDKILNYLKSLFQQ